MKLVLILTICGLCMVYAENYRNSECSVKITPESPSTRGIIAEVGGVNSILGSAGKNICVDANGADIAVMYGSPSEPYDAYHPFGGVFAAYSTNQGETWNHYGPFSTTSALLRFICPGIDGATNFSQNREELYSVWQEDINGTYVMNWGTHILTQLSEDCSMPCIGVNPDDPLHVMVTASNGANYTWISTDGGYTWSDTIMVTNSGHAGHFRWGSGDYAFFTYHDDYNGDEYPYYVESTDGGYTWTSPALLPAIGSNFLYWSEFDCEVIDDHPFAVYDDPEGVMQLFYPDPDNPGSPGAWNWIALDVDSIGTGVFSYQDTTWMTMVFHYPSIAYDSDHEIILITYEGFYEVTPPPVGWIDGCYLGGIVSIDHGRTWCPTRPLSEPVGGPNENPSETAHRLVTINDTTYCYSTWTDAGSSSIGNQYFELGVVLPIDLDGWNPGVAENDRGIRSAPNTNLTVFPSVVNHSCCVSFNISQPGIGNINFFDASGRLAKVVYSGYLKSGYHNYDITTSDLPNGIYMVVLKSDSAQDAAKLIKMR